MRTRIEGIGELRNTIRIGTAD
ncbi:hypothetical protein AB4089_15405 [Arthrobacter sp. 2MCAF15]